MTLKGHIKVQPLDIHADRDRSEGVRNPYDGGRVRNPYSSERRGSKLIEGTVQDQSSLNKEVRLKELSQNLRSEKRKVEKRKIKPSEA